MILKTCACGCTGEFLTRLKSKLYLNERHRQRAKGRRVRQRKPGRHLKWFLSAAEKAERRRAGICACTRACLTPVQPGDQFCAEHREQKRYRDSAQSKRIKWALSILKFAAEWKPTRWSA